MPMDETPAIPSTGLTDTTQQAAGCVKAGRRLGAHTVPCSPQLGACQTCSLKGLLLWQGSGANTSPRERCLGQTKSDIPIAYCCMTNHPKT